MNQHVNKLIPIPGAAGYLVNDQGDVFNLRPGRGCGLYLSKSVDRSGYCSYKLQWDGSAKRSTAMTHRLVALAFIPNPEGKPTVNHKDGNKQNNHVSNLEWATMREQQLHAINTGLRVIQRGADHYLFGSSHPPRTAATKAKMSTAKQGVHHPQFCGYYLTPAGRFASKAEAVAATGISRAVVHRRCHEQTPAGWSFEPAARVSAIKEPRPAAPQPALISRGRL